MNVFGMHWDRHFETIQANWQERVHMDDIVLLPGDISWAMQMPQAMKDLQSIAELPGRKILLRGNHDYWWSSITKIRSLLPERMYALQNDSLILDDFVFCGTRGWMLPTAQMPLEPQDQKIFVREVARLQLSLEHAQKHGLGKQLIALMHFPPLLADGEETPFTRLLEQAQTTEVVYGHLHGAGIKNGFLGERQGVGYHLVSCDAIQFAPYRLV